MTSRSFARLALVAMLSWGTAHAGNLAVVETIDQAAFGSTDALGVTTNATGQFVYLGGRTAVHVFERNILDGTLTQIQTIDNDTPGVSGLDRLMSLAISPDQKHLYAASFNDTVVVFARHLVTGLLTFVEAIEDAGPDPTAPMTVAVSHDGEHVYCARDEAVMAFARNSVSGALLHLDTVLDDTGGVDRLDQVRGIATGRQNTFLYAASFSEDALTMFTLAGGILTAITSVTDTVQLRDANQVVVSPDDLHIYVSTREGIAHYTLTPIGVPPFIALSFVDRTFDPLLLPATRGLAMTADGERVYAVNTDGWVTHLDRDVVTGTLTIASAAQIDQDATSVSVALIGDSAQVYATGQSDQGWDRLAVLRHMFVACPATAAATCKLSTLPVSSSLAMADGPSSDTVAWKWNKGEATALADFGAATGGGPVGFSDLAFCVYGSGGSTLLSTMQIPAGGTCAGKPCWKAGTTKYGYGNKTSAPDGISKLTLGAGSVGKAKIVLKGKGALPRAPFLTLPSLPLTTPVVAQLHTWGGNCWSTTHNSPTVNDGVRFKAKGD